MAGGEGGDAAGLARRTSVGFVNQELTKSTLACACGALALLQLASGEFLTAGANKSTLACAPPGAFAV